jgi:hypothetical protein
MLLFVSSVKLEEANWKLIVRSTDNGGPPGVLYELLVACFYYGFIAASIAEVFLELHPKRIWEHCL